MRTHPKIISVRIDPKTYKMFKKEASKVDSSISGYIRANLEKIAAKLEKVESKKKSFKKWEALI